jgi:hypothetical protein
MSKEEKYRAAITAVPMMTGERVMWGWRAELEDLSTEKKENFDFPGAFASSEEALKAGTRSLRTLVRAYDEVAIYSVDLYGPEPEPEDAPAADEEKADEPDTSESSDAEGGAAQDAAPAADAEETK